MPSASGMAIACRSAACAPSSTPAASASHGTVTRPRATSSLDPEAGAVSWHRVAYDIAAVQAAMLRAGLPRRLAERLSHGA